MKILFISSNRLGDAILSAGLLHQITKNGRFQVTIVTGAVAEPFFLGFPHLNKLIILKKHGKIGHWWDLWQQVRGEKWDMVIDLRSSAFGYFVKTKYRFILPPLKTEKHQIEHLCDALDFKHALQLQNDLSVPDSLPLWLRDQDKKEARDILKEHSIEKPYIVMAVGANWAGKIWPWQNFQQLAHSFKQKRIILIGDKHDDKIAQKIGSSDDLHIVNLCGKPSLLAVAAIIKGAEFYIGNDSGLTHLAATTGTPTLGLFGPSQEKRYRPWGKNGYFIRTKESCEQLRAMKKNNPYGTFMTSLSVDDVREKIKDICPDLLD